MYHLRRCTFALAIAATAMTTSAGQAGATTFCEAKKTADGVVAMRAGPGKSFKTVQRVRSGETVMLLGPRQKGWREAVYWPLSWRTPGSSMYGKQGPRGWIQGSLLTDCG